MLIRVADEFGFKIRTFQHVLEGYKVASEIATHGAGASTFTDWWALQDRGVRRHPLQRRDHGGARRASSSLNSDDDELRAAPLQRGGQGREVRRGAARPKRSKMVTLNPARQLGVDKRVGSIEVGKDADIAIFSAHPVRSRDAASR